MKYRFDIFVLSDISYSRISIGVIVDLSLSIKRMFPFRGYNYLLTIVCLLFLTQAKLWAYVCQLNIHYLLLCNFDLLTSFLSIITTLFLTLTFTYWNFYFALWSRLLATIIYCSRYQYRKPQYFHDHKYQRKISCDRLSCPSNGSNNLASLSPLGDTPKISKVPRAST